MITLKEIKTVINKKLFNEFNIEIQSHDVKEGFNRPSFFVTFDDTIHSATLEQIEKTLTVRIYYFPENRYDYSLELLDIQERLEKIFDLKLKVLDRHFNIHEVFSLVTDGVLDFSFDLQFFQGKDISLDAGYIDEKEEPILDSEGNPIQIEIMQNLEIEEGEF